MAHLGLRISFYCMALHPCDLQKCDHLIGNHHVRDHKQTECSYNNHSNCHSLYFSARFPAISLNESSASLL